MSKPSTLAGVAHDIAHHAGSFFGYLSPHLQQALRAAGSQAAQIDLLSPNPYPANAVELPPLRLALTALQARAKVILEKQNFSIADVSAITLYATPAPGKDDYWLHTRAVIISNKGRTFDSGWLDGL